MQKGGTTMHPQFSQLNTTWFLRAFVYTGSIGDFRYRYANDKAAGLIHVAVYTKYCYEEATDRVEQDFPWTDEGIEQLKQWMQEEYHLFSAENRL